jgi:hypothetical protein
VPEVIYTETSDEIVDLVERVRSAVDAEVALVLGAGTAGLQTPLNVRLLRQLGTSAGKKVSVISGDPYIQELSRVGGLATYASVPAFERGIQTVRPHPDEGQPGTFMGAATAGAAAGLVQPPGPPPPPPPRTATGAAEKTRGTGRLAGRRRPLYFVAAGLVILGLILFLVVAPSAKVTITLIGTQVSANPTIQGSPDPANAGQADHIVTSVVTSDQSAQFTATPTGKQAIAATPATASLVMQSKIAPGAQVTVGQGYEFDTTSSPPVKFTATQTVTVTFPQTSGGTFVNGSPAVPVQASVAGAAANVAANTIVIMNPDPCATGSGNHCGTGDLTVTNPAAAAGGADAKTNVIASTNDVNGWNAQVTQSEQTLTTQVNQDLATKAAGKTVAKDPGGNGTTIACTVTPALPAPNAVFATTQVTVACSGKAAVYNPADITKAVMGDLQQQVAQGDSLATSAVTCTKPSVTQAADDGTVVASVQCTGFSRPSIDLTALRGQLTGHSPGDVRNIIEHHLNHVQNVVVSQSPIPFFWLPFFASRIEIDESFVNTAGS